MRIIKIFSFLHLLISVGLLHGNSISIKQDSKNYEEMISFYLEILNGNFSSEYINGEDTLVISKEKPSWLNNKIKFKHLFLANYFSDLNDTNIYKEYFPQYFRDLVNERAIHSPRGATILDYYNSHYILSDSIRDVIDYKFQLKIDSLSNDTSNLYLIKFIELIIPSTRPSSSGYISRSKLIGCGSFETTY